MFKQSSLKLFLKIEIIEGWNLIKYKTQCVSSNFNNSKIFLIKRKNSLIYLDVQKLKFLIDQMANRKIQR